MQNINMQNYKSGDQFQLKKATGACERCRPCHMLEMPTEEVTS